MPAADREHRHEPRGGGGDRADPGVAALARHRLGRPGARSSSTPPTRARELARRLVAEGKAYEDEGAIRFRQPDEGDGRVGRRGPRPDRVPERPARRPRHRPLGRPPDLQLRVAGRRRATTGSRTSSAATTTSRTRRRRSTSCARSGPTCPSTRTCPNIIGADGQASSRSATARSSIDDFRARGLLPPALMNFLALLGWSYDDKTTVMSPARARRALLARARRPEPGDVRLREARLAERRVPARAAAGRVRAALCRLAARAGERLAARARPRDGAARAGEDREARRSTRRSSASSSSRSLRTAPTRRRARRPRERLAARRAVGGGGDRGGAARARRASSGRSRGRRSSRSGSPSRARRSRRGSSRASSCSAGTRRSARLAAAAQGL